MFYFHFRDFPTFTNSTNLQIINNCVSHLGFIIFWKFFSIDVELKLKKYCPHWGSNSQPSVQHSNVQSLVLYHSAIQAPSHILCLGIIIV